MDTIRFEHLVEIAAAEDCTYQDVVKEIAAKFHERYLTAAKGFAGTAATILTSILIPCFGQPRTMEELRISWYCFLFCLVCALVSLLVAVQYARGYAHLLRAVARLHSISPWLQRAGF